MDGCLCAMIYSDRIQYGYCKIRVAGHVEESQDSVFIHFIIFVAFKGIEPAIEYSSTVRQGTA
jgi:hypothetical protein